MLDGTAYPKAHIRVPLAMMNRHGLIAGATGTGKTKTLQLLTEQLSAAGCPVVVADMKGDLSGLAQAGAPATGSAQRAKDTGDDWTGTAFPVEFVALGGLGTGVPIRATMTSFGPTLLAKVLDLNDTQESSLNLVFHYADKAGLRAARPQGSARGHPVPDQRRGQGRPQPARRAVEGHRRRDPARPDQLEDAGGDVFFGEPEFETTDLLRHAPDGRGVITSVELPGLVDKPQLFSTFLMWLLADLFHELPEVGDPDKPKLVFFFDEAHLLFNGATKAFLRRGDPDRPADPVQGGRAFSSSPRTRPTCPTTCSASSATGCSTRCARSRPTTRPRCRRRCGPTRRRPTTTSPARCSNSAPARRSSPCCPSPARRRRSPGPGCGHRAR